MKRKDQIILDDIFEKTDFSQPQHRKSPKLVVQQYPTATKKQLKDMEKDRLLNISFDEFDADQLEQLDIFQLRFLLESGAFPMSSNQKLYIKEHNLRQMLGSMFLENSSHINRKEFPKFCNFFCQKRDEVTWETVSVINLFSDQDERLNDRRIKPYQNEPVQRFDVVHKQRLTRENITTGATLDDYHHLILNQFFQRTSTLQWDRPIQFISNEDKQRVNEVLVEPGKFNRREETNTLFGSFWGGLNVFDIYKPGVSEEMKNAQNVFVIQLSEIVWCFGPLDGLVVSFFFYDSKKNERVTSSYFEIMQQTDMSVMSKLGSTFAVSLDQKQVENAGLWGVIQIYKMFDGDQSLDGYIENGESKMCVKMIDKQRSASSKQRSKNEFFVQYLGTGVVDLKSDLLENRKSYYNMKVYSCDENDLSQYYKNVENGKSKILSASWGFKIEKLDHFTAANLIITQDGVIQNVEAQPAEANEKENEEIPMLYNIVRLKSSSQIYTDFYNTLFIFPTEIVVPKEKKKNCGYCITCQLRSDDIIKLTQPILCFYSTSNMSNLLLDKIKTSVTTGKQNIFTDEIRMKLPFPLTVKHHLLFTVSLVCSDDFSEKVIFYATLPLFRNSMIVSSMTYSLPLIRGEPTDGYLNQISMDGMKCSLNLKIDVQSTIYPREKNVFKLLNGQLAGMEGALASIQVQEAIHFLPSIVEFFIMKAKENSLEISYLFDIFAKIANLNKDPTKRSKFLTDFVVNYSIEDDKADVIVTELIYQFFVRISDSFGNLENVLKHSWVLLNILLKAMIVMIHNKKEIESKLATALILGCRKYSQNLRYMIINRGSRGVLEGNYNFGEFVERLYSLIDKATLTSIVIKHMTILSSSLSTDEVNKLDKKSDAFHMLGLCRIQFIGVLGFSPNFILFNNPKQLQLNSIEMMGDYFAENHLVSTYFVRDLLNITLRENIVGKIGMYTLVLLLVHFNYDSRFQEMNQQSEVSSIFFEVLIYLLDEFEKVKDFHYNPFSIQDEEIEDIKLMYLAMFYILKHLSYDIFKSWFEKEIPTRMEVFLIHIRRALMLFSHYPFLPKDPIVEIQILIATLRESVESSVSPSNHMMRNTIAIDFKTKPSRGSARLTTRMAGQDFLLSSEFGQDITKADIIPSQSLKPEKSEKELEEKLKQRKKGQRIEVRNVVREMSYIAMDCAEALFERFENGIDGGQSLERLEEIVSSTLFSVDESEEYLMKLNEFIRTLILRHRHFLFEGNSQFGGILLKNLLKNVNSTQENLKRNSVDLVYTMLKNNFIFSQNIECCMSDAAVSLSELNYNDIDEFRKMIRSLPVQAQKDFDDSYELIAQLRKRYWEEGQKNVSSLVSLQKINYVVEIGDLDVFVVFMDSVMEVYMDVIRIVQNLDTNEVFGEYIDVKSALLGELKTAMLFSEDDVEALKSIKKNVGKGFEQIQLKIESGIDKYCQFNKIYFEESRKLENDKVKDEKRKEAVLEMDHFFDIILSKIGKVLLDGKVTEFLNEIKTFSERWEDAIFESEELQKVTKMILEKTESILADYNCKVTQIDTAFYEQKKTDFSRDESIIDEKTKSKVKYIQTQYETSMQEISETNREEYLENVLHSITGLTENFLDLEMSIEKNRSDRCEVEERFCNFHEYQAVIAVGIQICEFYKTVKEQYNAKKEEKRKKEECLSEEIHFMIEVMKSYIWTSIGSNILQVHMRECGSYLKAVSAAAFLVLQRESEVQNGILESEKSYTKMVSVRGESSLKCTLEKSSVFSQVQKFSEVNKKNQKLFAELAECSKQISAAVLKEEQQEAIRKEYAVTLQYLFTATETFITHPQTINQAVFKDVQILSQRIGQFENSDDKFGKLNRYVDYKICKDPYQTRVNKIMDSYSDNMLGTNTKNVKKTATIKKKNRHNSNSFKPNIPVLKGNKFFGADLEFNRDSFIDVSKSQQMKFVGDLKEFVLAGDTILLKLNDIKNLTREKSTELLIERFMTFANEYQNTARVHIAWVKKMVDEYLKENVLCEAGICCLHIALYIGLLYDFKCEKLLEMCERPNVLGKKSGNVKENMNIVVSRVKQAAELFEACKRTKMAIKCYFVLVDIFEATKQIKELEICHNNLANLYQTISNDNDEFVDYYYLVGKNQKSFGFINRSEKSLDDFKKENINKGNLEDVVRVFPEKSYIKGEENGRTRVFYLEKGGKREKFVTEIAMPSMLLKQKVVECSIEDIKESTQESKVERSDEM
ncbi:hypothetical protein EIN_274860 [Entamoeba invadens IP1]|uniref:Dedicator of cytokinesis protein n=1 Tax=Entamoeba invadens IP1 TaxID=370355 RepID=A0A0A1U1I4_ENTIV|nr:hypothetical protein EIN_274860 [Entamoeba invadens IP1]ELP87899.1 hypothetical protein EIN_274860 [Entamoeba invadens IP1]|eukprot:XP_004254670.1 hypothetical protein EIN_274860 [Entamoeba invadens IP1]